MSIWPSQWRISRILRWKQWRKSARRRTWLDACEGFRERQKSLAACFEALADVQEATSQYGVKLTELERSARKMLGERVDH